MRKLLIGALGLVVALGCLGLGVASAFTTTQHIVGKVTPKKLPKNTRVPVKLFIDVFATTDDPSGIPSPATHGLVDFDKDTAFYQKGFPTCNYGQFTAATTTQEAKSDCSDSQIGTGTAVVLSPSSIGAPPLKVDATITAFNGKNKQIVLHTYNSVSGAQTLVGKVGPAKSGAGSAYGTTLDVVVPALAGGVGSIQEFNATIKKTYNYQGKKRSIFSAKCGSDKKLHFQARFTFKDGTSSTGTGTQTCTQKS